MKDAFVGVDVAFAKGKRLPVVVCTKQAGRLVPLLLRTLPEAFPPRGRGNRIALDDKGVHSFAQETLGYLRAIEKTHMIRIVRVAIDAPSCYKREGTSRRAAELAMDQRRISCFATPSQAEFEKIRSKAQRHLDEGGPESHMPHANQLWMLVGFALFEVLNKHYECIEVFPQAIAHALRARTIHKSSSEGMALQLAAVARHSGWPLKEENLSLSKVAFGSLQDKLDAYLSAWVASLSRKECHPCGEPPSDVIWIPRCRGNSHLNLKNAS